MARALLSVFIALACCAAQAQSGAQTGPQSGAQPRVAGTIEVSGYDATLDSQVAQDRCRMLAERIEKVLPGVCDTRLPEEGGDPQFWTGLRPATPTNIPYIGRTRVSGLWVNAGHGTLGWTHGAGSGKAMAELISGRMPRMHRRLSLWRPAPGSRRAARAAFPRSAGWPWPGTRSRSSP